MAKRSLLGVVLMVAVGVSAAVACADYVPPDVPTYGPPNALTGKTPLPPGDTTAGDSGSVVVPPPSDGGGGGPQVLCQTTGGTIVDGGPCAVSFSAQIFPKMQSGGSLNCGGTLNGCHGSATASAPKFDTSVAQTAAGYYAVLANYAQTDNGKKPYVNPCSIDPAQSDFVCNTLAAGATGECGSSMPLATPAAAADQALIAQWVACGAPNN